MKINYKNISIVTLMTILPLGSAKKAEPVITRNINTEFSSFNVKNALNNYQSKIDSFINIPMVRLQELEAKRSLNFIKMPNPHINMNVSKTKFQGNPKFLDMFLSGVLKNKGEQFYKAQEKYGINATFLIGIANHESFYGKSKYAVERNNIAGMRNRNGYIKYKSVDECIDKMAANLKEKYTDKGLHTIAQINKKYAEDAQWSSYVVKHMKPMYNSSKFSMYKF